MRTTRTRQSSDPPVQATHKPGLELPAFPRRSGRNIQRFQRHRDTYNVIHLSTVTSTAAVLRRSRNMWAAGKSVWRLMYRSRLIPRLHETLPASITQLMCPKVRCTFHGRNGEWWKGCDFSAKLKSTKTEKHHHHHQHDRCRWQDSRGGLQGPSTVVR